MIKILSRLLGDIERKEMDFISFTGEGFDEIRAWTHAKSLMLQWCEKHEQEGEKINIIKTTHYCAASRYSSICRMEVRYMFKKDESVVFTLKANKVEPGYIPVPVLARNLKSLLQTPLTGEELI